MMELQFSICLFTRNSTSLRFDIILYGQTISTRQLLFGLHFKSKATMHAHNLQNYFRKLSKSNNNIFTASDTTTVIELELY